MPLKTKYVKLLATVQERIPRALVDPTRVHERSAENQTRQQNKMRTFIFYYFLSCTLKINFNSKRMVTVSH